jgi:hypothetical protein
MIKATPRKFLAFGLSAAVALGVLVGAPSANAISGSNCNLKSKPSNASCDAPDEPYSDDEDNDYTTAKTNATTPDEKIQPTKSNARQ